MNTIKSEENSAKLIVSGLVPYYFSKRVQDLKIDFKIEKNSLRVIAEGNVKIKPKDLDELNRISNSVRLPEFENYYDTLIGFGSNASDVSTIEPNASMFETSLALLPNPIKVS